MLIASTKTSNDIEKYVDVSKNYDDEIKNLTKEGISDQYKHYFSLVTDALKKAGLKARNSDKVSNDELVRIGLFAEDTGLLEMLPEWLIGSLEADRVYFGKFFRFYAYENDREEEDNEETPSQEYIMSREVIAETPKKVNSFTDDNLAEELDKLKALRRQQVETVLYELTQKLFNSEMSSNSDVIVALGENKLLKQLLTICLSKLNVSVVTTAIALGEQEVVSKRTNFEPNNAHNYSLETLKNGLALASGRIEDLLKAETSFARADTNLKQKEAEKSQATKELSKANSEIEQYRKALEIEKHKPAINDAMPILYRIAWDDEGERYYLGTTDEEENKTKEGTYKVATLIKSTKKVDSIKFASKEDAQKQLEKAIKFYKNIDRKQIISLESLKNAYLVHLLEYEDKGFFKAKVTRSLS